MAKQTKQHTKQATVNRTKPQAVTPSMALTELRKRADQGDPEAQAALMRWLDHNPAIWRQIGDMAHHSQAELIRLVGKSDFVLTESIKRRMAEQRAELLGVFPTPLETLAVDRLIAARMHLEHVEAQCAKAEGEIPLAKFWLARQREAHESLSQCCEIVVAGPGIVACGCRTRRPRRERCSRHRTSLQRAVACEREWGKVPAFRIGCYSHERDQRDEERQAAGIGIVLTDTVPSPALPAFTPNGRDESLRRSPRLEFLH